MLKTDIYIALSSQNPRNEKRRFGYIIEAEGAKKNGKRDGFGEVEGTYHQATLQIMAKALKRYFNESEITIWIEDKFILNVHKNMEKWKKSGWINAKGDPVANAEEWKAFAEAAEKHTYTVQAGTHKYSEALREEMWKR